MANKALVEIRSSDTDELRILKINRNFRLLLGKALSGDAASPQGLRSPASLASSQAGVTSDELREYITADEAYQEFSTKDDIEDAVADLKSDLTWLTESQAFEAAVSDVVDRVIEAELADGGSIAEAIKAAVASSVLEGGAVASLVSDQVASAVEECKRYTDEQIAALGQTVATLAVDEEKGSDGINHPGGTA